MTSIGELRRRTLESVKRPSYSVSSLDMTLLNDNANLFGANPAVMEVASRFDFGRLWAYPSENSDALRQRIASEFGVSPEEVIVGNGSDELLDISSKCFINPGDVFCEPVPTFSMYRFYARVNMAEVTAVPLGPGFSLDVDGMLSANAKLTSLCQPNNPTGNQFLAGDVRKVLEESKGVVVVDEAYSDFSGSSMAKEVLESERGIDVRTFSKAYGMAGLRAGFGLARKEVIDELRRVRTPFGLNSFTEAVAIRALDNRAWVSQVVSQVRAERDYLSTRMRAMGFRVFPSVCNFVTARSPVNGPVLVADLKGRGIVVRDLDAFPQMKDCIRVTVAPRAMLDRFLGTVEDLLQGAAE